MGIVLWPKVVQQYFLLKTCCIVNDSKSITEKTVKGGRRGLDPSIFGWLICEHPLTPWRSLPSSFGQHHNTAIVIIVFTQTSENVLHSLSFLTIIFGKLRSPGFPIKAEKLKNCTRYRGTFIRCNERISIVNMLGLCTELIRRKVKLWFFLNGGNKVN